MPILICQFFGHCQSVGKTELLAAKKQSEIIPNLRNDSLRAGLIPETQRIEPLELEWKRKDDTKLKARLTCTLFSRARIR